MSEFAARIGRVCMKNGGADVHVLRSRPGPDGGEDWRGSLVGNARAIAEMGTPDNPLAGYVVLGLFSNGGTSLGYRYDYEAKGAVPRMLLPAWVAELIRRDLIANKEAHDVFSEMFEWVE